jgi:hypothetical protein
VATGAQEAAVNPVLANILYRSANDSTTALDASRTSAQAAGENPPQRSQQALARVAVGKGIRHSFTMKKPAPLPGRTTNVPISDSPVEASLSALKSNFKNSLQDIDEASVKDIDAASDITAAQVLSRTEPSAISEYIPGSMRRDDSLVDLAMIPLVEDGGTQEHLDTSMGLTFIDFPWQDPNFFSTDVN